MKLKKLRLQNGVAVAALILVVTVMLGSACSMVPGAAGSTDNSEADGLVIRYLTAPQQIAPLKGTDIICVVTDKNEGTLQYDWSATGGEIKPQEEPESIKWFAPEKTGNYTISVVVTDSQGARVTRSVTIAVTNEPDQYPIIYSVTCNDCKYRTEASKLSTYDIKCENISIEQYWKRTC